MTMKRWAIFALLCCSGVTLAQKAVSGPACEPGKACRGGDVINLTVEGVIPQVPALTTYQAALTSTKGVTTSLTLVGKANPATVAADCIAKVGDTATVLCIVLPDKLADDTYTIKVNKAGGKPEDALSVSPSQVVVQQPVVTAVSPAGSFSEPNKANSAEKVNTVVVLGKGFQGSLGRDNKPDDKTIVDRYASLRFTDLGTPARCPGGGSAQPGGCYELSVDSDQQVTLTFHGILANAGLFGGKKSFVIAVDGVETNASTLTLINTTPGFPMTVAVVGFLLIALIVFLLLKNGDGAVKRTMNGKNYWLSVLFFDVQSNSYSLSKCQFYAWTGAAVIGYLFLAISKSVVQGSGVFPDIPPGLPGILMASVGTVVISTGITSSKGGKGAGNPGPNLSDFIATGGVVAPDRLQFAIWTIIGIGTFLSIILQSDPRNINDLPTIPSGFLQLMGISSAGYLAGKLTRKAGPTISAMVVTSTLANRSDKSNPVQSVMSFQITGSGLSKSALFSIDGVQIFPDKVHGKEIGSEGPDILQQDPSINDLDYGRVLFFSIDNPPDIWRSGPHDFAIINPDAQKAVIQYQTLKATSAIVKIAAGGAAPAASATPAVPTPQPANPAGTAGVQPGTTPGAAAGTSDAGNPSSTSHSSNTSSTSLPSEPVVLPGQTPAPPSPAPPASPAAPAAATPGQPSATVTVTGECLDSSLTAKIQFDTGDPAAVQTTSDGKNPATFTGTVTDARLVLNTPVTVVLSDSAGASAKVDTTVS
jgi:hypothetical protein